VQGRAGLRLAAGQDAGVHRRSLRQCRMRNPQTCVVLRTERRAVGKRYRRASRDAAGTPSPADGVTGLYFVDEPAMMTAGEHPLDAIARQRSCGARGYRRRGSHDESLS
jgi:hypothetical protein